MLKYIVGMCIGVVYCYKYTECDADHDLFFYGSYLAHSSNVITDPKPKE